jgi:dihydroorotase
MTIKTIKNTLIINEGKSYYGDILIKGDTIEKIGGIIDSKGEEIIAEGKWTMPGVIDDQVHFREPGLTHKACIASESKAAVAGGVTSFMEMPNTKPTTTTIEELEKKYAIGKKDSWCNYSFFMGATNDNIEEIQKVDFTEVCGLKVFMGSSTGDMLVDAEATLEKIFCNVDALIATHCEDEPRIRQQMAKYKAEYGDRLTAEFHPIIRDEEACYLSSSKAVELAKKHNSRLHVLHISTEEELALFTSNVPLKQKRITAEVCVHHLYFTAEDYHCLGNKIKCNPAIKDARHSAALIKALQDGTLDIIATDHAPHTLEEKSLPYIEAPSGLPLIQHSLQLMLDYVDQGIFTKEFVVDKMCHAPSQCFKIKDRGFIKEGYKADIVLVNPDNPLTVSSKNVHYQCGWSPLEDKLFNNTISATLVNGHIVYKEGIFYKNGLGNRLNFF